MSLKQYKNPKEEECGWRLSKRRVRNETGALSPLDWISRCVACNDKHQTLTVRHNVIKTETRHRIRYHLYLLFPWRWNGGERCSSTQATSFAPHALDYPETEGHARKGMVLRRCPRFTSRSVEGTENGRRHVRLHPYDWRRTLQPRKVRHWVRYPPGYVGTRPVV